MKLNSQPTVIHTSAQNVSEGVISLSDEKTRGRSDNKFLQGQGVNQETEWGSDDESQFLEIPDPATSKDLDNKNLTLPPQNPVKVFSEKSLDQSSGNHLLNNSLDSYRSESKQNDKSVRKPAEKAKFPGPAGLLICSSVSFLLFRKYKVFITNKYLCCSRVTS